MKEFVSLCAPEPNSGCWLWTGTVGRGGYGVFRGKAAHRASWEFCYGPIPPGLLVLHKCDVRCCVNPDHLFLGSHKDNTADMVKKGRDKFENSGTFVDGESHRYAKLTEDAVRHILSRAISGRKAAKLYNVHPSSVWDVRSRRTWKHVSP